MSEPLCEYSYSILETYNSLSPTAVPTTLSNCITTTDCIKYVTFDNAPYPGTGLSFRFKILISYGTDGVTAQSF